jgi:hypothetical protein
MQATAYAGYAKCRKKQRNLPFAALTRTLPCSPRHLSPNLLAKTSKRFRAVYIFSHWLSDPVIGSRNNAKTFPIAGLAMRFYPL